MPFDEKLDVVCKVQGEAGPQRDLPGVFSQVGRGETSVAPVFSPEGSAKRHVEGGEAVAFAVAEPAVPAVSLLSAMVAVERRGIEGLGVEGSEGVPGELEARTATRPPVTM